MRCWLLLILTAFLGAADPSRHDLTWTGLGKDAGDSVPLGNGDVALQVRTEANGPLVVVIAKNDAWAENIPPDPRAWPNGRSSRPAAVAQSSWPRICRRIGVKHLG
jgi:hypothetical protein